MADVPIHSIVTVTANMRIPPFSLLPVGSLASEGLRVATNSPVVLKSPPKKAVLTPSVGALLKNSHRSEKNGCGGKIPPSLLQQPAIVLPISQLLSISSLACPPVLAWSRTNAHIKRFCIIRALTRCAARFPPRIQSCYTSNAFLLL